MGEKSFLFYPESWASGTQGFTFAHKGAYLELLVYQFHNGPFTAAEAKIVLGESYVSIWPVLRGKFTKKGSKYFNFRLKSESEKRKKFTESRRLNLLGSNKKGEKSAKKTQKRKSPYGAPYGRPYGKGSKKQAETYSFKDVKLPFESEDFKGNWIQWLEYKETQFGFIYKSLKSHQAALNRVYRLSRGMEKTAIAILQQSIEQTWKGLFALKDTPKSEYDEKSKTTRSYEKRRAELRDLFSGTSGTEDI